MARRARRALAGVLLLLGADAGARAASCTGGPGHYPLHVSDADIPEDVYEALCEGKAAAPVAHVATAAAIGVTLATASALPRLTANPNAVGNVAAGVARWRGADEARAQAVGNAAADATSLTRSAVVAGSRLADSGARVASTIRNTVIVGRNAARAVDDLARIQNSSARLRDSMNRLSTLKRTRPEKYSAMSKRLARLEEREAALTAKLEAMGSHV